MDNTKLREIGMLLSKSVRLYKTSCEKDRAKIYAEIIKLCHTYVYFYTVNILNEDDLAESFSQFMIKNLGSSIKLYDTKKGDFTSFMTSYIFSGFRLFKSKQSRGDYNTEIINDALNRDIINYYHIDSPLKNEGQTHFKKVNLSDIEKRRVIAFVLMMARGIDECSITKIADIIGLDEKKLRNLIYATIEKDNATNGTEEKINKSITLRNLYYIRILRIKRLNYGCQLNQYDKELLLKYKKMLTEHNAKIAKLSVISQKIVAEMLEIDYKMVRSEIFRAKKLITKLFSITEETE